MPGAAGGIGGGCACDRGKDVINVGKGADIDGLMGKVGILLCWFIDCTCYIHVHTYSVGM